MSGDALLRYATPRHTSRGFERVARRALLAAAARGGGGAIELTEAGWARRLGIGEPVAHVTVHDPRTYGAMLRSGSVGLGASYVAGWWDADDLTALARALFWRTHRLRDLTDRLGRSFSGPLDLPARSRAPDARTTGATCGRITTFPTSSSRSCSTRQ